MFRFKEYDRILLSYVATDVISHWDSVIRELGSKSLGKLVEGRMLNVSNGVDSFILDTILPILV